MIQSIRIHQFRGIRQGEVSDLAPLTVLVGPNGSGKSSVLQALHFGASPQPQIAFQKAHQRQHEELHTDRWLRWRGLASNPAWVEVSSGTGEKRKCEIRPGSRVSVSSENPSTGSEPNWSGEVRWVEPPLADRDRRLDQLYTWAVEQGRIGQAEGIIGEVVPELRGLRILTEGNSPVLHVVFENGSVPIAVSGDGVKSLVRISLELASLTGGVVLIEEPELHQHPAAIWQTARAILVAVRREVQVVLTTHSLELIDAILGEGTDDDKRQLALFRFSLPDGVLHTRRIPGEEASFLRGEIESDLR